MGAPGCEVVLRAARDELRDVVGALFQVASKLAQRRTIDRARCLKGSGTNERSDLDPGLLGTGTKFRDLVVGEPHRDRDRPLDRDRNFFAVIEIGEVVRLVVVLGQLGL